METPYYVFDDERFEANANDFFCSFSEKFGRNFIVSYSFKTNPSPPVLNAARRQLGLYAEIVSKDELVLAEKSGFALNEIIYNGVIRDPEGKFDVAANGGIVNVENLRELKDIAGIAEKRRKRIDVGIRISFRPNGMKSRFGFEYGCDDYRTAIGFAAEHPYIDIVGIHCHGHGGRYLEDWKRRMDFLVPIAKELNAKYIDFGSNMFGAMDRRLACQFDGHVPTPAEYAGVIYEGLEGTFDKEDMPVVIVEPGTPLVSNAVSLVGVVVDIRKHYGRNVIQTDCSMYDCGYFLGSDKHLPIDVVHVSKGDYVTNAQVYGYTCAESDIIVDSFDGEVAVGDLIVVRNVGAYGHSLSSNFIKKSPPTRIITGFNANFD